MLNLLFNFKFCLIFKFLIRFNVQPSTQLSNLLISLNIVNKLHSSSKFVDSITNTEQLKKVPFIQKVPFV